MYQFVLVYCVHVVRSFNWSICYFGSTIGSSNNNHNNHEEKREKEERRKKNIWFSPVQAVAICVFFLMVTQIFEVHTYTHTHTLTQKRSARLVLKKTFCILVPKYTYVWN